MRSRSSRLLSWECKQLLPSFLLKDLARITLGTEQRSPRRRKSIESHAEVVKL